MKADEQYQTTVVGNIARLSTEVQEQMEAYREQGRQPDTRGGEACGREDQVQDAPSRRKDGARGAGNGILLIGLRKQHVGGYAKRTAGGCVCGVTHLGGGGGSRVVLPFRELIND